MEMKCPMCGGTKLDEPRTIKCSTEVDVTVYVVRAGWFGRGQLDVRGRACRDCGFVAMVVDHDKLGAELEKA